MSGRPNTANASPDTDTVTARPDTARQPSTLGGWARAICWGALAVVAFGAILLLVAPGELVGARVVDGQVEAPCNPAGDQAGCQLLEPAMTAIVLPTIISTPGQVPFARSPTH